MSSARPADGVHSVATQSDPRDVGASGGPAQGSRVPMDETQVTASPRKPHPAAAYHEQRASDSTRRAIAAARRIIETEGLNALTVEKVAANTGIAKTTLYRRWPNSLAMARAVYAVADQEVDLACEVVTWKYGRHNDLDPERPFADRAAVLAASVAERLGETKR